MRKSLLFFAFFVCLVTEAQEVKMLCDDAMWYYNYGVDVVSCNVVAGNIRVVGGKEYQTVEWGHNWVGAKPGIGVQAVPVEPIAAQLLLREDGSRIYAHKEEFMSVMKKAYHFGEAEVFVEANGDDEVVLYDFSLGVGDRYPCTGDVIVSDVRNLNCRDGMMRKVFTLSNGLVLIEGIGCVNSSGEFLGYQTLGVLSEDDCLGWPVLASFSISNHLVYKGGDEDSVYQRKMLAPYRLWTFSSSMIPYEIYGAYSQYVSRLKPGSLKNYIVVNRGYDELHMRECGGKIFVPRFEYEQAMKRYFGNVAADGLFMEDYGEDEALLYDFTLGVGDRYPCKGHVTVSSVEEVTMIDGIVRKQLLLSNGLVLIEGVGCVNSPYDFYGYQNATAANEIGDATASGNLLLCKNTGEEEERQTIFKIEDYISSVEIGQYTKSYPRFSNGQIYDLSGRRVSSTSKGVYIQNGKKIIIN